MNKVKDFIESGIIEMYVMGNATTEETLQVRQMAAMYDEVRMEIDSVSAALEGYARSHAIEPDPTIKTFLMATIDYMERIKNGEAPSCPPLLHEDSKISDYAQWLDREDLLLTEPLEDAHACIIGYTPEVTTAIVWLKYGAPPETHTKELEKFLIVEGACEITIGQHIYKLGPADTLTIPLHISHHVKITSACPCKFILQRIAA